MARRRPRACRLLAWLALVLPWPAPAEDIRERLAEREENETLTRDLQMARAEGAAWGERAQSYLSGLGLEIHKQFELWKLTFAEREVGLLMLKGFSHGEIAALRGTTEATVRHQARAVYQKADLPGRSAFCAYFLEDLLPARAPGEDRPQPS